MSESEWQLGSGCGFGVVVDGWFVGEVTRRRSSGPFQNGPIGYWIDQAVASRSLVSEAVVVVLQCV